MANKRMLKLEDYGISTKRYKELCGFCEQYPEWKEALKYKSESLKSAAITRMTGKTGTASPTEALALYRQELEEKCDLVEQTAREADEALYPYLIASVCYEKPIWYLRDLKGMACSDSAFKDRRKYFFFLLNKHKK